MCLSVCNSVHVLCSRYCNRLNSWYCCLWPVQMKKKVKALEERSIADKPWQLSGEASDRLRPENSLLQDHLDFDHTSQPGQFGA